MQWGDLSNGNKGDCSSSRHSIYLAACRVIAVTKGFRILRAGTLLEKANGDTGRGRTYRVPESISYFRCCWIWGPVGRCGHRKAGFWLQKQIGNCSVGFLEWNLQCGTGGCESNCLKTNQKLLVTGKRLHFRGCQRLIDRPASSPVAMHFDEIYGCQRLAHKQTCAKCAVEKIWNVSVMGCVEVMRWLLQEKKKVLVFIKSFFQSGLNGWMFCHWASNYGPNRFLYLNAYKIVVKYLWALKYRRS